MRLEQFIARLREIQAGNLPARLEEVGLDMNLEPMTALTDAVLAAWIAFWAASLLERADGRRPVMWWGWSFIAATISTLAGVAYHGARTEFGYTTIVILWKIVPLATGAAALCMGAASAMAWLRPRARRIVIAILAIEYVGCIVWAMFSNSFLVVAIDYVPVLLAVLIGALLHWRESSARFIAAGIVTSFVAVGVQLSPLHLGVFDHNDLFHVIQMAAMHLLYRGAVGLREGDPETE